jgi:gas vesicle protein
MKFLIGFSIGIVLGLIYAPAPGSETREELKNKAKDLAKVPREQAAHLARAGREKAGDIGARIGRNAAEAAVQAMEERITGESA